MVRMTEHKTLPVRLFVGQLYPEPVVPIVIEYVTTPFHDSLQLFAVNFNVVKNLSLSEQVKWILSKEAKVLSVNFSVLDYLLVILLKDSCV